MLQIKAKVPIGIAIWHLRPIYLGGIIYEKIRAILHLLPENVFLAIRIKQNIIVKTIPKFFTTLRI